MRAKYVMFDWGNSNVPILFPAHIGHDEIIKMVQSVYSGVTPMSAGFISHNHEVYGESHSTELKSKPEDSFWIKLMLNMGESYLFLMILSAKYVMFDWGNSNVPILFPAHIGHDEIIKMVQSVYSGVTPMSAGFISHNHEVYGESHSTELKSKPEDSFWIKLMFKEN